VLSAGTRTGTHADGRTPPSCASLSCAPSLLEGAPSLLWVSPPARTPVRPPVRPCDHSANACLFVRVFVGSPACLPVVPPVAPLRTAVGVLARPSACPHPRPPPRPLRGCSLWTLLLNAPFWALSLVGAPSCGRPPVGALPPSRTPPGGCEQLRAGPAPELFRNSRGRGAALRHNLEFYKFWIDLSVEGRVNQQVTDIFWFKQKPFGWIV
jgi:hypothetical protein